MDSAQVSVRHGDEIAVVYAEGGIGFRWRVKGVGWVVCDEPSMLIMRLAVAVRREAFPTLPDISVHDVADCGSARDRQLYAEQQSEY